ncbi:hypothetical protein RRF57_005818 [Xylaria bambusicola]|uniref:Uncharacterized protein n=1 Tax=Xylaria bambusicola TaxID=326684 RepID=A0AAN7UIG5_9PEZI
MGAASHLDSKRLVFLFGEFGATINNFDGTYTGRYLSRSTQILCRPSYNVSNYEIFQSMGSVPELLPAQDPQTRKFDYLQAWDLAQVIADLYLEGPPSTFMAVIQEGLDLGSFWLSTDMSTGSMLFCWLSQLS